jgi:hypothetical protein
MIEIENEYKTMKGTEGIDLRLPRTTEVKVCLVVSAEVPLRFELDKSIVTTTEGVTDSHSVRIGMAERRRGMGSTMRVVMKVVVIVRVTIITQR